MTVLIWLMTAVHIVVALVLIILVLMQKSSDQGVGAAFGGAHFDAELGKLVVGVTDAAKLAEVRATGAQARIVAHSSGELDAVAAELDRNNK